MKSNHLYFYFEALFRVGVDPRIVNLESKTAEAYIPENLQLMTLYKSYGEGIWAAVESSNIQETERLMKGKKNLIIFLSFNITLFKF